ncbi:hypothetical protein FRC08_002220 [Ceratobasidium sp. 394]|nr:hypothetical protein FRC08_002220 [Ceratobasidium sp. 394]
MFVRRRSWLGPSLQSLYIAVNCALLEPFDIVDLVRQILSCAPNLNDLTLSIGSSAVREIIRDAHYPFSLLRFASPAVDSQSTPDGEFSSFLRGLDSLEELVVLSDPLLEITNDISIGGITPQSLPRLHSLFANPQMVMTLVPGRPVTRVGIQHGVLGYPDYEPFATALSRSLAQIDVVDVSIIYTWIYVLLVHDNGLVTAMHRHSVQPKHLRIKLALRAEEADVEDDAELFHKMYPDLLAVLGRMDCSGFDRLETLEVTQRSGSVAWMRRAGASFQTEGGIFAQMKRACPSLKVLNLFDVVIRD